jgi:hypothetical protein
MPESRGAARLVLYGATIFLSAFLLFLVQPIFGKLILPWFGGSSAVWTTCLVFFQTALLAGYGYAHFLTQRAAAKSQGWIHLTLLASAVVTLPALPGERWKPSGVGDPVWQILAMLTVVLGLPYFLLAATSPLLQKWLTRDGSQPYKLFALSNAGSLLALAAYPILIEPHIPTRTQDLVWSVGFAIFAVLSACSAFLAKPEPAERSTPGTELRQSSAPWLVLSAAGSMLLVSTTNQLTQNVAAVPFLWILPLSVYLLSFIICFESPRWYRRGLFLRLLAVTLGSLAYVLYDIETSVAIVVAIPLFTIGLFIACMFCHGELSRRKPDTSRLTSFYLMIALGGASGAIAAGMIAPRIFTGIHEFPTSLVLVATLALWVNWREGYSARLLWITVSVAMLVALTAEVRSYRKDALVMMRSFYGSLRVVNAMRGGNPVRMLYHGIVQHGAQYQDPVKRREPVMYFGPQSGAGLVLQFCCNGPKRAGIIGLGAGTLAAYGRPGDTFEFYEINPQVIEIAKSQFTYLSDSKAAIRIATGDARLTMESETGDPYDVFLADAFSGDAIPVHLLTKEAFGLYIRHLKSSGIMAVHISNQYLDLAPVVAQLASEYGLTSRLIHSPKDEDRAYAQADWIVMSRDARFFEKPEIASVVKIIPPHPGLRLWIDDYNNLLQVFKF